MTTTSSIPSIQALNVFTKSIGVSPATVWRWRQQGILSVCNINGRPYVTTEAAAAFVARVTAGEFAKTKPMPVSPRAAAAAHAGAA
jgi:hypothetical protein